MNHIVTELVALVGGSASQGVRTRPKSRTRMAGGVRRQVKRSKEHEFTTSNQAWHQIAGGGGRKEKAPAAARETSRQSLPLDDDETDLDGFNA